MIGKSINEKPMKEKCRKLFRILCGLSAALLLAMTVPTLHAAPSAAAGDEASSIVGNEGLHFHSTLVGEEGNPLAGVHLVTFCIRDNEEASGAVLWTETLLVKTGENGQYALDLATGAPDRTRTELRTHPLLYVTTSIPGSTRTNAAKVITTIPQGIWVDCNPDNTSCDGVSGLTSESELKTIAAAHFRYVFNDSNMWGTQAQITSWASQANTSGVKIIWYITSDFALYQGTATKSYSLISNDTELASSFCSGCTNAAFTTALINWLKTLPATAGYYIDDEDMNMASQDEIQNYNGKNISESAMATDIGTLYKAIHAADPNHTIYGAETWDSVNSATESELAGYLDPIEADLNVMGADYYPVGTGEAPSMVGTAAGWLDTIANDYSKSTFMNLQAFSWEDFVPAACASKSVCVYPTVSQLQTMLQDAAGATKAPAVLVWYDYGDTVSNGQWSNLVSAADPQ